MQFRRSGQRDDRRRRVLNDPQWGAVSRKPRRSRVTGQALGFEEAEENGNYPDAKFLDEQPRLTDLVPRRLYVYAILLIVGIGLIGSLEALYAWMPQLAALTHDGTVATFDLDCEGSLAVWFSSMTLALAGLTAILVFTVRRHRKDDYQGIYRIWLWAAACWILMSLDETASLHEAFKEMMACVTGTRLLGDGSIWWVTAYVFLLGAVGTRLLIDMRRCRLSTGAMIGAAVCYVVAVVVQMGLVLPESGARGVMVEEGAEMLGNLLLLLGMGLHARYVLLDAEGLLPKRRRRVVTVEVEEDEEEMDFEDVSNEHLLLGGEQALTVHPPHGLVRPPAAASRSRWPEPSPETEDEDELEIQSPVRRKLTKGEKKALRRRMEKMRRKRRGG